MAALELTGIEVRVPDGERDRAVLDGIDLRVDAGELAVVTGPSGSGKSTLLAVAGLLRRPDAGTVALGGTVAPATGDRARSALRRRHVALVFQSANLLGALTALEQLQLVGHLRGERPRATAARAWALLDEVGMGGHADKRPHQLSGGERQRVGLARALMARPTVLLADEPTASLDPDLATSVAQLIAAQTARHGLATLLVTHDPEPLAVATRRLHLDRGALAEVEHLAG
jgi:putative ABC transport system ATP-binding protein